MKDRFRPVFRVSGIKKIERLFAIMEKTLELTPQSGVQWLSQLILML